MYYAVLEWGGDEKGEVEAALETNPNQTRPSSLSLTEPL